MKKHYYETPLCESMKLEFESPVLTGSGEPDALGNPGMPGNDLGELDPLLF
ncbi:MAG: hypothetical protein IJQ35_02475 [Bacteroidales bacterium]|nr:hypothetical protein [Bacteroidales bacterium]